MAETVIPVQTSLAPKRRFWKTWMWWVVAVGAVGAYFVFGRGGAKETYVTVKPTRGEVAAVVTATGSATPEARYDLAFEVTGVVDALPVKVGDEVPFNAPLVKLLARDAQIGVLEAKAGYQAALASLKQVTDGTKAEDIALSETLLRTSEVELARAEELVRNQVATGQADVQSASDAVNRAEAELAKASAKSVTDVQSAYAEGVTALRVNLQKLRQSWTLMDRIRRDYLMNRDMISRGLFMQGLLSSAAAELDGLAQQLDTAGNNQAALDAAFDKAYQAVTAMRASLIYLRYTALEDIQIRDTFPTTEKSAVDAERAVVDGVETALTGARQLIETRKAAAALAEQQARSVVDAARTAAGVAQERFGSTQSTAQVDVARARSAVERYRAELALKKANARSADVNLAIAEVDRAKAVLQRAEEQEKKTVLTAPVAGIVTAVQVDKGETVRVGDVAVSLISQAPFRIEANIAEIDIARLELGDVVSIDFDAYPGRTWQGTVLKKYPAETVVDGVIYYRVEIGFENVGNEVRSGMTANLRIVTEEKQDALLVPYVAVLREGVEDFVRVRVGDSYEKRRVVLGIQGETMVEVIDGLQGDEEIVTAIKTK